MLSRSVASPLRPAPSEAPPSAAVRPDGFLDAVGPCTGAHVLVLGNSRAGLMGELIGRGCLAAMSLRPGAKPEAGVFDTVLVPHLAPGDDLDRIVRCTWRALAPQGGTVLCQVDATRGGVPGPELERRLRLHGFDAVRMRLFNGALLLRAVLKPSAAVAHHG